MSELSDLQSFSEKKIDQQIVGYEYQYKKYLVFFGNRFCEKTNLKILYPELYFSEVKQTHGDAIVESYISKADNRFDSLVSDSGFNLTSMTEADAHFTSEKNHALLIKTADCLPIMIFDESSDKIIAVHAGWRGVVNKITLKAIENQFADSKNLKIIIGPNIRKNSFEVDDDVFQKIMESVTSELINNSLTKNQIEIELKNSYESKMNSNQNKFYIDLIYILKTQLKVHFSDKFFDYDVLSIDTKSDLNWNSFRRDKENSKRNYSFIAQKF